MMIVRADGNSVEIEIFADEQWLDKFICIGCLFIPIEEKNKIYQDLRSLRCLNPRNEVGFSEDCEIKCKYHEMNNREIKWLKLKKDNIRSKIAEKWMKYLVKRNKDNRTIRFNLLYINKQNLDVDCFGRRENLDNKVYTRFFRSCIFYGSLSFFDGKKVIIKNIFHDKGSQEAYSIFSRTTIRNLIKDRRIVINCDKIIFIDSDHKREVKFKEESTFIQFIDVIMGAVSYLLFNSPKVKKSEKILRVVCPLRPLVSRLIHEPKNKNSSYHYYNRQLISFWPKEKRKKDEIIRSGVVSENLFYFPKFSHLEREWHSYCEAQKCKTLDNWW